MFAIGNVVRSPSYGSLYVVGENECLIPFDTFNSTTHPPKEDRYGTIETCNEDDDIIEETVLFAHSIDKYEYVAATIEELIVNRIKKLLLS